MMVEMMAEYLDIDLAYSQELGLALALEQPLDILPRHPYIASQQSQAQTLVWALYLLVNTLAD